MNPKTSPTVVKWPFYLADVLLLALAGFLVYQSPRPMGKWEVLSCVASVMLAALCSFLPYLLDYRALVRLMESESINDMVARIQQLEEVGRQISIATSQWQSVQELCGSTVAAAKDISTRMTEEAKAFASFMQQADAMEKSHLKLEVDKLRRAEGDWLQTLCRVLDHVHALYSAGVRSGQKSLILQFASFQDACRDAARRVGLVAFGAEPGAPFDAERHQTVDSRTDVPPGAAVGEVLATGYTFQSQLIRRAVVSLAAPPAPETAAAIATSPANVEIESTLAPASGRELAVEPGDDEVERQIAEAEAAAELPPEEPPSGSVGERPL